MYVLLWLPWIIAPPDAVPERCPVCAAQTKLAPNGWVVRPLRYKGRFSLPVRRLRCPRCDASPRAPVRGVAPRGEAEALLAWATVQYVFGTRLHEIVGENEDGLHRTTVWRHLSDLNDPTPFLLHRASFGRRRDLYCAWMTYTQRDYDRVLKRPGLGYYPTGWVLARGRGGATWRATVEWLRIYLALMWRGRPDRTDRLVREYRRVPAWFSANLARGTLPRDAISLMFDVAHWYRFAYDPASRLTRLRRESDAGPSDTPGT